MIYMPPWLGKYSWVNFDFSETCWKTLLYYIFKTHLNKRNRTILLLSGLYPSTFADLRFSWRTEFYGHRLLQPNVRQHVGPSQVGFHMGWSNLPLWGPGAMPLEALALSLITDFQTAFPCIWWPNLFLY